MFTDGRAVQIENVWTAPAHRRRGLARGLVEPAVAHAQRDGADLVFLVAAATDWPRRLYVGSASPTPAAPRLSPGASTLAH